MDRPAAAALLAVNAIPLVGVLAWNWSVFDIVFLYWLENLVIGGYNVLKMAIAAPHGVAGLAPKAFLIPFFIVHYGMFCLGHGIFLFALFSDDALSGGGAEELAVEVWDVLADPLLKFALAGLALSHGISFVRNYLWRGEFRRTNPGALMAQPYVRIVIMHVAILAGGFLVMKLGSPVFLLVVLIGLKTLIDLASHRREHRKLAAGT